MLTDYTVVIENMTYENKILPKLCMLLIPHIPRKQYSTTQTWHIGTASLQIVYIGTQQCFENVALFISIFCSDKKLKRLSKLQRKNSSAVLFDTSNVHILPHRDIRLAIVQNRFQKVKVFASPHASKCVWLSHFIIRPSYCAEYQGRARHGKMTCATRMA